MNKIQFRNNLIDPNVKFLAFQPRNYSRHYNKSKSNKKNHLNKNILSPCEPLGQKLLKAAMEKNQKKIPHNRRQKTQSSFMQKSMSIDGSRCLNHPDKKGDYFLQTHPNKKFCLKCTLSLNGGNHSTFITKQKHQKKEVLDQFKKELLELKSELSSHTEVLYSSIQLAQQNFSEHSNYINDSFMKIKEQVDEKRRELLNNLIIAQQHLKKYYEENVRKVKKMNKSLEKYELDIKMFYDQIIQELPKNDFDLTMNEYHDKITTNIKNKLKNILIQDGICVYIPNVQIKKMIEKANVQFYQPISWTSQKKQGQVFVQKNANQMKRSGSNSLDSKMNELISNIGLHKRQTDVNFQQKSPHFNVVQKKKQVQLNLLDKKVINLMGKNPNFNQVNRNWQIEDKQNINFQNITQDYINYNKNDQFSKFTFKP